MKARGILRDRLLSEKICTRKS